MFKKFKGKFHAKKSGDFDSGEDESVRPIEVGPNDAVIAIMGLTGTGKSTFISLFTEEHVEVSDKLESCTSNVSVYRCPMTKGTLHLLDTPGFDDTHKSETEVLREIAAYLSLAYKHKIRLSGIIYLHRITDGRLGGAALRNLFMFKKLCGDKSLSSVVLVTSWWSKLDDVEEGNRREQQLMTTKEFWGGMIEKGSKVFRHDGTQESATKIVSYLVEKSRPVVLDIQRQMVEQNMTLDETTAGKEVGGELLRQKLKYDKELKQLQQERKEALKKKDDESAAQLRKTEETFMAKLKKIEEDQGQLRTTHEQARRQHEQELKQRTEVMAKLLEERKLEIREKEHDLEMAKVRGEMNMKIQAMQHERDTATKEAERIQLEMQKNSGGCVVS